MAQHPEPRMIAIACQGGGTHTAFTAGALRVILRQLDPARYAIVGLSGTSGGAINALIAWYGLLIGDREKAAQTLLDFWNDTAAKTIPDAMTNDWFLTTLRLADLGLMPQVSPYAVPQVARQFLQDLLERHIPFDQLPSLVTPRSPQLLVGAVNERTGQFKVFPGARITVDTILASAAVPNIFRTVRIRQGIDSGDYWDGLFSQNPPVRDFVSVPPNAADKPDEIWVIRINPEQDAQEPRTVVEIATRRNSLSGNLSLNQELDFIRKVNEWVVQGVVPAARFKIVTIREISLDLSLDHISKWDRSPVFLRRLIARGEERAEQIIDSLMSRTAATPQRV
jgi:NTE family protein